MQVSPTGSCYLQISIVILTLFKFIVLCDCATISASLFTLDLYLPLSLGRALYLEVQGILISSYLSLLSEKGGDSHLVSRAHLLLKSGQVLCLRLHGHEREWLLLRWLLLWLLQ